MQYSANPKDNKVVPGENKQSGIINEGYSTTMWNDRGLGDGHRRGAHVFEGFHMDNAGPDPEDQHVGDDDHAMQGETGLTLQTYALGLGLPVDWLKAIGLSTIDNPWAPGRAAVAIPYRRRDGSPFRNRIRQAVRPVHTKRSRTLWDRWPEKLGALLYGLDRLPAPGCPLMLVDDEAACRLLWHHGFDAIATQGSGCYVTSRDDPELSSFSITVIATAAGGLLKRLTRSRHRKRIAVATLDGFADLMTLH